MEALKLGLREQQYFAELFQSCDVDGSGKVTGPRASELFLASGLTADILIQITELCGAKRLGHFGRSQFYVALKLVSLAQAGLPVKLDALNSGKNIPLPKFSPKGIDQVFIIGDRKKSCGDSDNIGTESKLNPQLSGQLPPPPVIKKSHSRSLSGHYRGTVPDVPIITSSQSSHFSSSQGSMKADSPQNSKSPPFSPTESPPISPANQKPALLKKATAPAMAFASSLTNISSCVASSQQIPMVMTSSMDSTDFTSQLINPSSLVSDIGHVNPVALSEGSGTTVDHIITNNVGGVHTNHNENKHDVPQLHHQRQVQSQENGIWTMFEDDEHHMLIGTGVKQFITLEPPGFDSSSISSEAESVDDVWTITEEQREYYINQFKTMQPDLSASITGPIAKHFFEKSKLPVVELSKIWQLSDLNCDGALSLEEFCIAMHLVVLRRNDIEMPDRLPLSLMPYSTLSNDEPFAADLPPGSTLKRATPPSPQQSVAQWTAFASETPDSCEAQSPVQPANFEFAKPSVDNDLKIVQPVPVHVVPEVKPFESEGSDRSRTFSVPAIGSKFIQLPPGTNLESQSGVTERANNLIASRSQVHFPPTPPPRPPYARSMSLDVKSSSQLVAPQLFASQLFASQLIAPAIPPRVTQKEACVSVAHTEPLTVLNQAIVTTAADKDKIEDDDSVDNSAKERLQSSLILRQCSRDSRDIHMALRTHKERNAMLTRLNSELNQELQEVMEQRIALEIQLEHLKPFSS